MKQIAKKYHNVENTVEFSTQQSENSDYNDITKEFQKGAVYYYPVKSKAAQEVLYVYDEEQYENSKKIAVESSFLGFPVSDQITDNNGISISYFELGAIVSGIGIPEPIICRYTFPKIGNPGIVSPDRAYEIKNFICGTFDHIKRSVYDYIIEKRPHFFSEIFSNSFFLRPVSSKSPIDDVLLVPEINVEPIISPVTNEREVTVSIPLGPGPSVPLHDKTLFDLVFKFVNQFVLVPHGIYANKSWDNFVIMHITDLHVSRRIEYAKDDLKGQPDFIFESNISHFNNFNDNFRDFISYANSLHKNGSLDCILATGDLVDYIFESAEQTTKTQRNPGNVDRVNGNNFDFLKRLILGLEPGRDGTKNEELLVPIFTSLGNHDYRDMPYCWLGEIEFDVGLGGIDITLDTIPVTNYANTNLLRTEALALEGGKKPVFDDENGKKMAHIDRSLPQYEDTINSSRSYIVQLGPHRIVVLDSGPDIGIIDSEWKGIVHTLGWDSDDSKRFAQSSPNTEGIKQEHIQLLNQAIAEAGSAGIVIVGIHAPLMDLSYYPHYLRETERSSGALDVNVMERGFPYFSPFCSFGGDYNGSGKNSNWPMTGTPYFKFGGVDFTLANGVSKGLNKEFLEICTGVGLSRKVDLILSGHGHHNVEFRIEFDPDKKILFFHDYYTENPLRYYATKILSESDFDKFKKEAKFEGVTDISPPVGTAFAKYQQKMFYHFITPKDGLNQSIFTQFDDSQPGGQPWIHVNFDVPPYPTPLNKTGDKMGWWTKHRPLFVQTVALGPIETKNDGARNPEKRLSDYSFFHGCRKITIKNNVISSIEVVHMSEIRGPRPRLCSMRELCSVRGVSFPASLRSIAEQIKSIPPICDRLKIS